MATANTFTQIGSTVTVGSGGAASITFSSIPATFTDLVLRCSLRSTDSVNSSDTIVLSFNGSTANFSARVLYGTGSAVASLGRAATSTVTWMDVATDTVSTFASVDFYIPNYTSANYKSVSSDLTSEENTSVSYATLTAGLWSNTAAITSIEFTCNGSFAQYSTFYLYGVAALGTTPAIVPYATGGDTIMTDGTYWYHAFLASGTFTPAKALSCDVLVVAGGGGGGHSTGGQAAGGGAGGLLSFSSQSLGVSSYTCTVGAGGAVASANTLPGSNGGTSQFGGLTASVGGGGGGSGNGPTGISGGSGGGGASIDSGTSTPGTGTAGQGNNGGAGNGAPHYAAAGGGGAGAVGGSASSGNAGSGGIGATSSLINSMGIGTGTGQLSSGNYYFAGGGAGINGVSPTQTPTGGLGGGGASITAGTANTGGGGGGRAAGGSGIVIVRYPV